MTALDKLSQAIPYSQALANKAIATSLAQISGITNSQLPAFAKAVTGTQSLYGLDKLNSQTTPINTATYNYFTKDFGQGSGSNGTVLLTDLLGTAAGIPYTKLFLETIDIFNSLDLSQLELCYNTMLDCINGKFNSTTSPGTVDIPSGAVAPGTYPSIDSAVNAVITETNSTIENLATQYPTQVATLNQYWNQMVDHLIKEQYLQQEADLDFNTLTSNEKSAIFGFIASLPSEGINTEEGGTVQMLESVADLGKSSGQAIVGTLRSGKTQATLSAARITTNTTIPDIPNPPLEPAPLLPTAYPYP